MAPSLKAQLQPVINALAIEPRPSSVYRILYSIEDDVLGVLVVKVGQRSDVYR